MDLDYSDQCVAADSLLANRPFRASPASPNRLADNPHGRGYRHVSDRTDSAFLADDKEAGLD